MISRSAIIDKRLARMDDLLAVPGEVRIVEANPIVTLAEIRGLCVARNPVIDEVARIRKAQRRATDG